MNITDIIVDPPPDPLATIATIGADPAKAATELLATLTKPNYYLRIGIGFVVLIGLGVAVYYRDKINAGTAGSFDFLNVIPTSVLLVAGGCSVIVCVLIAFFHFQYNGKSIGQIGWVYWIIIPILIYLTSFVVTIINQQLSAGTTDASSAASASVSPLMSGLAALLFGSSAYVRAPVISAFPVINSVKVVDDVLSAEEVNPVLKGVGIGYWLWWLVYISLTAALGKAAINRA